VFGYRKAGAKCLGVMFSEGGKGEVKFEEIGQETTV